MQVSQQEKANELKYLVAMLPSQQETSDNKQQQKKPEELSTAFVASSKVETLFEA